MQRWLLSILAALTFLTGCDQTDDNALVVGMELTYPPFETTRDGRPDGISVRLAEDLGKYLDRPVKIRNVSFDGIIAALNSGKIDLIISSMTKTEVRARSINFSDGYVTNGLCLLVGKNSPVQSVADLKKEGVKIAVKQATTGDLWGKENLPNAKFTTLDAAANCALEVVQGRADAFIYDQISIYKFWKKYPEETTAILDPIRKETWGIGVRKTDNELLDQVNAFLKEYRAAGGFERLADQYMKAEKETFEKMGVPFVF